MDKINLDKNRMTKLVAVMLLSMGLLIVVILAQKQQEIRSKATSPEVYNAFEVTDNTGNQLQYKDESGVRTYETQSLDVRIKVSDLEKLIE